MAVEIIDKIDFLIKTLQAVGGIAILWIGVSLWKWWAERKRDKKIAELHKEIRGIKSILRKSKPNLKKA